MEVPLGDPGGGEGFFSVVACPLRICEMGLSGCGGSGGSWVLLVQFIGVD